MSGKQSSTIISGYEHPVTIKTMKSRYSNVYKTYDENSKEFYKNNNNKGIYSTFSENIDPSMYEKELKNIRK